ncbi:MAG: ribosomal protein S18-alanine N-acetyltransferase [Acidobacteriota bacterium]|nr:MAG: ribosomal protein S18-alanine N-acetyltransferase [Acidobacteriota bacterium]
MSIEDLHNKDVYQVKAADPSHISELIKIGDETGLSPWSAQNYLDEMKRDDSVILKISDDHNQISGFICGRIPISELGEAEIFNIAVRPAFRGKGQILLDEFLEMCRQRGTRKVWLEVRASNEKAHNFYARNGFVRSGIRRNFYSYPVEDAVLMCLTVENESA